MSSSSRISELLNLSLFCFMLASCAAAPGPTPFCTEATGRQYDLNEFKLSSFYDSELINGMIIGTSQKIDIPSYKYLLNGNSYYLKGDDITIELASKHRADVSPCELITQLSLQPVTPVLQWKNITAPLVVAAIFKSPIGRSSDKSKIVNDGEAIWGWHSGLGTGKEVNGNWSVNFADGRGLQNRKILNDILAAPLELNQIYYWAVWSWDEDGVKIERSSVQQIFLTMQPDYIIPQTEILNSFNAQGNWILKNTQGISQSQLNIGKIIIASQRCPVITILNMSGQIVYSGEYQGTLSQYKVNSIQTDCYSLFLDVEVNGSVARIEFERF